MNFNSLPAKVVVDIFSRMTPTELLATERVNRNWQRLVRETLEKNVETVLMGPIRESYFCHHLQNYRKIMLLKKMFDYILKEKREIIEEALAREYRNVWFWEGLQGQPQGMQLQLLISCLSKLRGVRSINLMNLKISVQTLVQVFELCPKLECLNICGTFVNSFDEEIPYFDRTDLNEDDWIQFVNSFGHRLVHLWVCQFLNSERLFNLLGNFSDNLHLEKIGFGFCAQLTEEIVTTIQQLQQTRNVFVLVAFSVNESVSLVMIDEIKCTYFNWNSLPDHCQRLSLLQFESLNPIQDFDSPDQFKSVNFTGLKTLVVAKVDDLVLQVLARSQFPILEKLEITFTLEAFINDLDPTLGLLFEKMPSLVKFDFYYCSQVQQHMLGPSILRLNSLAEIDLRVMIQPDWDIQVMVDSIEMIGQLASLKKLSLDFLLDILLEERLIQWRSAIEQQSAALRNLRPELAVELYLFDVADVD